MTHKHEESKSLSNKELKETLSELLKGEEELNAIVRKISESPESHGYFGTLQHYNDNLDNVRIVIQMIKTTLKESDGSVHHDGHHDLIT